MKRKRRAALLRPSVMGSMKTVWEKAESFPFPLLSRTAAATTAVFTGTNMIMNMNVFLRLSQYTGSVKRDA